MTTVTRALVAAANRLPVGIEILLNDPEASLAVAHAAGADFIRTDYFADEMSRPEHGVMRIAPERGDRLPRAHRGRPCARPGRHPGQVRADARPAHARGVRARRARAGRRCDRRHGHAHGRAASPQDVLAAREGAGDCPVLVGSGLAPGNARALLEVADGAIVGTSLMRGGRAAFEQSRRWRPRAREIRLRGRLRRRPLRRAPSRPGRRHRAQRRRARTSPVRAGRHRHGRGARRRRRRRRLVRDALARAGVEGASRSCQV